MEYDTGEEEGCGKEDVRAEVGVEGSDGENEGWDLHDCTQTEYVAPVHANGVLDDEDIHRVVYPARQPVHPTPIVQQPQHYVGDEIGLEEPARTIGPHAGLLYACDVAIGGEVVVCEREG